MSEKTLIVHDGRPAGGLGATVLARLLRRSGVSVAVEPLDARRGATSFWVDQIEEAMRRPESEETRLVIFGITFYDLDPDLCKRQFQGLLDRYMAVEVWSHRWPDGYYEHLKEGGLSRVKIHIPPDDIVYGSMGAELQAHEKFLLRLSLVSARAIPTGYSSPDLGMARSLKKWIDSDPKRHWELLLETQALDEAVASATVESPPVDTSEGIEYLEAYDSEVGIAEVKISGNHATQEVEILEALCDEGKLPPSAVILVWLEADRVLLYRRDFDASLPSLRWLIENRYASMVPTEIANKHYGTQDAVYFRVAGIADFRSRLGRRLKALAQRLAAAQTGGRYLTASLARDLADLANGVFSSIDLRGSYTSSERPQIEVMATDLYELVHTSSRTKERRKTLTMPVQVHGPDATAFLYRDGGYNLQKAERLLEGAVTGLGMKRLAWLGSQEIPQRLRLDIRPPVLGNDGHQYMASVRAALAAPRMGTLQARNGYVSRNSVIGRFLAYCDMKTLVCFNESETIGPSVAHAMSCFQPGREVLAHKGCGSHVDARRGVGVTTR